MDESPNDEYEYASRIAMQVAAEEGAAPRRPPLGANRPAKLLLAGMIVGGVVLIALLPISALSAWSDVKLDLQLDSQQEDRYLAAPGCGFVVAQTDPSLPPCTESTAVVVGKKTESHGSNSGIVDDFYIILREPNGEKHSYKVNDYFAWQCSIGDTVNERFWNGHVMDLEANGNITNVYDDGIEVGPSLVRAGLWLLVFFVDVRLLRLLWTFWRW